LDKPQILWIGHSYTTPFVCVKRHKHPYYHMFYILTGTLRFIVDDKTYFVGPGQCFLVPRNTNHAFFNDEDFSGDYLEIKFSLLNSALEAQTLLAGVKKSERDLAGALFKQIFDEYATSGTGADEAASTYLMAVLNILSENERRQKKQQFRYMTAIECSETSRKVILYLEEHYSEDVSLDTLAKVMNLNKSYLCVAFKKDTQMTILDCLNTIRIRRAAELVVYSEYSLTQIAEACGFASDSHFNRVFLKYAGITPGQCRRAFPAGIVVHQENANITAATNNFLYSVLAQKSITPQEVKDFELIEEE